MDELSLITNEKCVDDVKKEAGGLKFRDDDKKLGSFVWVTSLGQSVRRDVVDAFGY